jgi:hypothetical protein
MAGLASKRTLNLLDVKVFKVYEEKIGEVKSTNFLWLVIDSSLSYETHTGNIFAKIIPVCN